MAEHVASSLLSQELLLSVAEQLKLPLLQIARQAEHGRLTNETDAGAIIDSKKEVDFLAGVDDTMEYDAFSQPASMKGKAGAKMHFQTFTKAFPDSKSTVVNGFGVEDFAVVESTMTGTQKGAMGPIKATNKPVTMHGLEIFKIANGKMVRGWGYNNTGELMTQLGLMPQPGAAKTEGAKPADIKKPAAPAAPATPAKPASPASHP